MKVEGSKFTTIIASTDAYRAMFWPELDDRREAGPHRLGNGFFRQSVDDDFEDAADILVKIRFHCPAQGRAIRIIGRGHHGFVFGANLGTRSHNTTGERQNDTLNVIHRRDREFGGAHRGFEGRAHDEEIAATDSFLGETRRRLAEKLAIHDRNPPKVAVQEFFRDLPAIAEIEATSQWNLRSVDLRSMTVEKHNQAVALPLSATGAKGLNGREYNSTSDWLSMSSGTP